MRGIAFHRLDEIGDEIVPLPQLHVDIGTRRESLSAADRDDLSK